MANELERRVQEKKVYEHVVEMVVDYVSGEFPEEESRLRIYSLISANFEGMVRALSHNPSTTSIKSIIFGEDNG